MTGKRITGVSMILVSVLLACGPAGLFFAIPAFVFLIYGVMLLRPER